MYNVLWAFRLPERKTLKGLNFFKKTTQTKLLCLQRQSRSRAENLWALETVLQQSVSPSDLISLLQLLISHAPVEPGRHSSRTESSQRSPHLGFEFCRANIDWLFCVSLTTQFLFFMSLSPSHTLRLISCLSFTCTPSFSLSDLYLLWFTPPLTQHLLFLFSFQWPCMPSVRSILLVWWCVWCWRWLRWCACCLRWLSPVSSSITWETTQRGRSRPLKTAVTRTTRGILGIFMTRSRQDRINVKIHTNIYRNNITEIFCKVPHWFFTPLHRSSDLSVACLSASHQFCLPVWVNCDSAAPVWCGCHNFSCLTLLNYDLTAVTVKPNCGFVYSSPPCNHIISGATHKYPSLNNFVKLTNASKVTCLNQFLNIKTALLEVCLWRQCSSHILAALHWWKKMHWWTFWLCLKALLLI